MMDTKINETLCALNYFVHDNLLKSTVSIPDFNAQRKQNIAAHEHNLCTTKRYIPMTSLPNNIPMIRWLNFLWF